MSSSSSRESVDRPAGQAPTVGRGQLLWNVLVFQLKLLADGLRDILLSPVSLGAAVLGLLRGGAEPDKYFKHVLQWGRTTEHWINLFGHHAGEDTADSLLEPLKTRAFEEAENNPVVKKLGSDLNDRLDRLAQKSTSSTEPTPPAGAGKNTDQS